MNGEPVLRAHGIAEVATLSLLLLNLVTVHQQTLSQIFGLSDGHAYISAFIAALLAANGRHQVWVLAPIPGIGGLIAAGAARHTAPVR